MVTSYTPTLVSGRGVRTYGIVRALAATGPVDLLYTQFGAPAPASAYAEISRVQLHAVQPGRGLRRALAYARARGTGVPDALARGVSPELARAAARLAAAPGRGRVVADDPIVAATLAGLSRRRPVIYSAHNLESAFRHESAGRGLGSRRQLAAFERRVMRRSAETWMVSRADMEGAAKLAPGAALRLVPNVVDVAAIEPVVTRSGLPEGLMIGDFTYGPNREGLAFLLEEVLPRVWDLAPEVRLNVIGRGLDREERSGGRVRIHGFVDDLSPHYVTAGCALVPLLIGGGSPLKFVEALARGVPVVATSRAAAGLEAVAGRDFFAGDGPEGFASAMLEALTQPHRADQVAAAGRVLAEREYSIEALTRRLAA